MSAWQVVTKLYSAVTALWRGSNHDLLMLGPYCTAVLISVASRPLRIFTLSEITHSKLCICHTEPRAYECYL